MGLGSRIYRLWYGLTAALGAVACAIPLFNLVGYESAALFGVVCGPVSVFLTLHAFHTGDLASPLASERSRHPFDDFARLAGRHLGLLVVPLGVLSLNALRVQNCDFATGLLFWALIPVPAILVGQTVGWVLAAVGPRRRLYRHLAAVAVIVASAASFGLHLALEPPIVGHQWFLGYFSGSIYDEALALPGSLVAYRATNLLVVAAVLAGLEAVRRRRTGGSIRWEASVAAVAAISALALWANWHDLGVGLDRGYIRAELGGRAETEHFVVHHPRTETFVDRRDRLTEDLEYRYDEMREFFETDPASDRKIEVYVYPDRDEKGRLMGGRKTLVAKLWLGEMHVLWPRFGHHWLAHELAHVFTAPFGATPLRISVQNGLGVNMGLVEGIATAADWPVEDLSPHQAAAALRRLDMAPDLGSIVGAGGFWTKASGRAYTLTGSFIRYLVDRHGIEPLKRAYGWGEFEEAYGRPVGELVDRWEAFVDDRELSEETMQAARYLYRRPSIFEKVCARTTAELRRRARLAAARGEVGEMRRLYDRLLGFVPDHVDYRIEYARRLLEVDAYARSGEMVDRLLERDLPPVQRARLLQLRGDLQWHRERPERAASAYGRCLEEGLPVEMRRLVGVKRTAVGRASEQIRRLAFEYFLGGHPGGVSLFFPMQWARLAPGDALARYLVGRRLWQRRLWERTESYLEGLAGELERPALAAEARRMLARTLYARGKLDAASRQFRRARESDIPRYRAEADEWLRRIEWRRRRARPPAAE